MQMRLIISIKKIVVQIVERYRHVVILTFYKGYRHGSCFWFYPKFFSPRFKNEMHGSSYSIDSIHNDSIYNNVCFNGKMLYNDFYKYIDLSEYIGYYLKN